MAGYSTTINYADALSALTREAVEPDRIWDQVFNSSPLWAGLLSACVEEQEGGLFFREIANIGKSPNSQFYSGAGDFKMATYDGEISLDWDWKLAHDAVVATGFELIANEDSPYKIVDIVQARVDLAAVSLKDMMAGAIYTNNPYGTNIDGSAGNIDAFEGLSVLVDDGTVSSTVGGQSRTTYPYLKAIVNYANALGGTFLQAMDALHIRANLSDSSRTDANYTTASVFNYYWNALQPSERYVVDRTRGEGMGTKNTGGQNLAFNDSPVMVDPKCPTGIFAPGTSSGPTGGMWYGLNFDFFKFPIHPKRAFTQGEWRQDIGSDTYFMDVWYAGALLCVRPNKNYASWIQGG